jgi:hypothetical protein
VTQRRRKRAAPIDPYTAWGLLALRTAETLARSAQVIHHRTRRNNSPAELFEMGNEKIQAGIESGHAMARHMLAMRGTSVLGFSKQWAALLSSGLAPFHTKVRRNARRATRRR